MSNKKELTFAINSVEQADKVTDIHGKELHYDGLQDGLIASNDVIHYQNSGLID